LFVIFVDTYKLQSLKGGIDLLRVDHDNSFL
jgi:hypothetical protein